MCITSSSRSLKYENNRDNFDMLEWIDNLKAQTLEELIKNGVKFYSEIT